ncbi:MAG: aminopeptidase [Elusimicrobia bacterium]|nr:aminopeptidase [Elusimicrobiota bacterium]
MFTQTELEKYAQILVWALREARTREFKKYDTVLVNYDIAALDLAEKVYEILLKERLNPVLQAQSSENSAKSFYSLSDDAQLKFTPQWFEQLHKSVNGLISIRAPQSLTHLKDIEPKKIALSALSKKPFRDILNAREAAGEFGWTLCSYPTQALADGAKMTAADYAGQIKKACYLKVQNPVKKWREIYKDMNEIAAWLYGLKIDTINTRTKSMDLTVKLGDKRKFLCARGCNIPSFEIFTSPDWRGTNGTYYANMQALRSGNIVEDIRIEFKDGRVVKSGAGKGENYLKKMLEMDKGAAQVGEYSLTDKRFSKIDRFMADTLFDENFGGLHGNCHIALGSSYADTYTGNVARLTKEKKTALGYNDSSLHWDIINTEDKVVKAKLKNGKIVTIYEKGQFKF